MLNALETLVILCLGGECNDLYPNIPHSYFLGTRFQSQRIQWVNDTDIQPRVWHMYQ